MSIANKMIDDVKNDANSKILESINGIVAMMNLAAYSRVHDETENVMLLKNDMQHYSNGDVALYDAAHAKLIVSQHLIENFSDVVYAEFIPKENESGLIDGSIVVHMPDSSSEEMEVALEVYLQELKGITGG